MEQAFVVLPLMAIICSFFMIATGMWANKACKMRMWSLWPVGLIAQGCAIWFLFYNTDSLDTLVNGGSPRMTLYDSVHLYGAIGYKIWFWIGVVLCSLFLIVNMAAPWLPMEEKKTPS